MLIINMRIRVPKRLLDMKCTDHSCKILAYDNEDGTVDLKVTSIERETKNAIRVPVRTKDGPILIWLPKSQVQRIWLRY